MTERNVMPLGGSGSAVAVDATLTQAGQAADAKVTGEEIRSLSATSLDAHYNLLVRAATSSAAVDRLFARWWVENWVDGKTTRNELLARWFGAVLDDERVHGVKLPLFDTSNAAIGELTDDSAGLTCEPSTASTAGRDDFARLPQFWCVEVSAEKNADGTHTIYAVEHIDDIAAVRSGEHLCWVLQKNTYVREWKADGYHYMKMQCHPAEGYHTWPQGTDKNGTTYPYIANPKYYAGIGADGRITCGTGLAPVNYTSRNSSVQLWRKRGAQYAGASGNLLKWQLAMFWLKYARKGNSGTIEGCSSFYCRYSAAIGESAVERIIITTAQAANLLVGCNVHIGTSSDGYQIARDVTVTAIESVTIDDASYAAVYVDNGGKTFDTTAGGTYISTMPWKSGRNDDVLGYDGSRTNYTNGKEPGLIQKTEFMNGSYLIVADELQQWGKNEAGEFTFDCYTCADQAKVTTNGSVSADYVKRTEITLIFPASQTSGWLYCEDTAITEDGAVLWPEKVSTAAGSGTGVKAGLYVNPASSGGRASWCCGFLYAGGYAGLACRSSVYGVTNSNWDGSAGSPGLAG